MASPFENFLRSIIGRFGATSNKVWQSVKKHPVFKSTTNINIQKGIDRVQTYWQQGKDWASWKATDVVGEKVAKSASTPKGKLVITYTVPLERDKPPKGGSTGSKTRTFSIEVSDKATKKNIRDIIAQETRDWLEEHYEEVDPSKVLNNLRIKGIE